MVQPAFTTSSGSDLIATENDLMCNFYPEDTGLEGLIINAMAQGGMRHGPRLKVAVRTGKLGSNPFDAVVAISAQPFVKEGVLSATDERRVFAFIVENLDVLMGIWDESVRCTQAPQLFRRPSPR